MGRTCWLDQADTDFCRLWLYINVLNRPIEPYLVSDSKDLVRRTKQLYEETTMQPFLDKYQREHMYNQYVLTIINDGTWYREAYPCWKNNNFDGFRNHTLAFITKTRQDLRHSVRSTDETRFIVLSCWDHLIQSNLNRLMTIHDIPEQSYINTFERWIHQVKCEAAFGTQPISKPESLSETLEDTQMNSTATAFETKHFVFGSDISTLSSNQLIDAIKKVEAEIADLKSVKTKSKHITERVKELEDMLGKIVEALDAK